MSARRALIVRLAELEQQERWREVLALAPGDRRALFEDWRGWAHEGQLAPAGDWRVWLIRAGRGFGKTRAGAEWVHALARADGSARIALVGSTLDDVRRVMVEGESGLIASAWPHEPVRWRREAGEVDFASGAVAYAFSAAAGEKLRGPQHHAAWCDELAKWRDGETAWDNLMLGMRLGERPRTLVTTTPRPGPLMRRLLATEGLVETRGGTVDNPWLPASYLEAMRREYGDTRRGRQELAGEMIEDVEGALWTRGLIEACRASGVPALVRVVVGVDPPAGTVDGSAGDACGIVAVGLDEAGCGHVLEDASVATAAPEAWAAAVVRCAARHGAERVVAEANNGGRMVASVLLTAEAALPVKLVSATRGKAARAEPVAVLYARGRVRHAGAFPALEDELCGLVPGGRYAGPGRSPDRADALVWAVSELMLGTRVTAAVRHL